MRVLFCCLTAFFVGMALLPAQTGPDPSKVDPNLWKKVKNGASAEFLIVLKEQAEVRESQKFRDKADKGRFVYATLIETSERTQQPVRAMLDHFGRHAQKLGANSGWHRRHAAAVEMSPLGQRGKVGSNCSRFLHSHPPF